jgi:hypothetical protein
MELEMPLDSDDGQCTFCGTSIRDGVFAICREAEIMHFSESLGLHRAEVEVSGLKSVAKYCSKKCRSRGRKVALSAERIPLPATPPSVGPVEVCAMCGGIVDMSRWHLVYLQSDNALKKTAVGHDVKELAVVCRKCAPVQLFKKREF